LGGGRSLPRNIQRVAGVGRADSSAKAKLDPTDYRRLTNPYYRNG
jgi:hypothetical protein